MHQIESVSLENVVSFKSAAVNFNENPITFVRGLNLDSDPANPTSNGAGKSLLMSCPSNVFYFSPPLALKKRAKKEILQKNSSIALRIKSVDGHVYDIEQRASKYVIKRDGEDLGLRTVPLAEKFIREKIYPIPESVHYTTTYVSTQRPFALQSSSNVDRLNLLSEMFALDDYDHIKRYLLNKLGEIKESELKLQVLERNLLEVNTSLKRIKRARSGKDGDSISDLKSRRLELEKKIEALVSEEFSAKSLLNDLKTLGTVEKELDALRSSYPSKLTPQKYRAYLKTQLKLVRASETYEELMVSYKSTIKDTQRKLDSLELPKFDAAKVNTKIKSLESEIETASDLVDALKSKRTKHLQYKAQFAECEKALKDCGYSVDSPPDMKASYDDDIAQCRTTMKLERLLKDHDLHDDSTCPTCMSAIDLKRIKKLVAKAKGRLPALVAAKQAQSVWLSIQDVIRKGKDLGFQAKDFDKAKEKLARRRERWFAYVAMAKVWDRHETYSRVLRSVKRPEAPAEKPDVDLSLDQIDDNIQLCEDIISHLAARTKLIENNEALSGLRTTKAVEARVQESKRVLSSVQEKLSGFRSKLSKTVKQLDELNAAQHEHGVYIEQRKKLVRKIEDLRPLIEDKQLLEVLVKAYSTKGLKTIVANDICGLLEQNLNAYSNLIFAEPFVFTVEAKDSGLSIIVDRGNGHVSDVRNLSGAESNSFRLLAVFSILPLLPMDKRVNMLILDEPCAHMDETSRAKFLHVFLPALAEIVPNIYVITPNESDYCEGSRQWTIRKRNGKSMVVLDGEFSSPAHDIDAVIEATKPSSRRKTGRKSVKKRK